MGRLTPLAEANDAGRYGGKAAGLARLIGWGFDVPAGFALAPEVDPDEVAPSDVAMAPPWAVRSSAVGEDGARASFAGQHLTILGVGPDGLRDAIRAVRASGGSAGALAYRAGMCVGGDVRMGVVVQRLVAAERSYVAFGVDPVTGADVVVIEGVRGGGEPLVAGEVNPDRFVVDRQGRMANQVRGDEPCGASIDEIVAIARLVRAVGARAGGPQDVEIGVEGGRTHLLQARPVSTR